MVGYAYKFRVGAIHEAAFLCGGNPRIKKRQDSGSRTPLFPDGKADARSGGFLQV
jgi:hypothetical protein